MSGTWVTNMQHFLDEDGTIGPKLGPARNLAEYIGLIVTSVTVQMEGLSFPPVPCRRRPGHKPCIGEVDAFLDWETGEIIWLCPECLDNGIVSGWKGTLWDCRRTNQ